MKLKIGAVSAMLGLAMLGAPTMAQADVTVVIQQVHTEYAAGFMDGPTRDDLVTSLERAQSSEFGSDTYTDLVAVFRVMLSAFMESRVNTGAAGRIFEKASEL